MHHAGEAAAADERTLCPDTGPVLGRIRHHMGFFDGTAAVPGLFQQSDRRGIVSGADASYRGAAGAGGTGRPGRTFHQPAPGVGAGVSGGDRSGSDVGLGSQPSADGGAVCTHRRMPDGNAAIFQLHGYGVADGRGRPELRVGTRHRLGMLCGAGAAPGSADGAVRCLRGCLRYWPWRCGDSGQHRLPEWKGRGPRFLPTSSCCGNIPGLCCCLRHAHC